MTKRSWVLESGTVWFFSRLHMFISLLLMVGGFLMIIYTAKVVDFTGRFDFAERWFLSGGTYTFIKLSGLAMIILSFMWLTGGLQAFLGAVLGPVIPGSGY